MAHQTILGKLVVLKARWDLGAKKVGLVISQDGSRIMVLWTTEDGMLHWTWHTAEAVLALDDSNLQKVKQRCFLAM